LKDLRSGSVVADASPNFDLVQDTSDSRLLRLELLDHLKRSDSFELTIKIIDAEGDSVQKEFGLSMRDGVSGFGSARVLDISIDSVEVEDKVVAENENNFVVVGDLRKEIDVDVRLTSLEDIEDARVEAILTFENGDVVADTTKTFDITKDQKTNKKLELPLIGVFEQGNFKLKIRVIDAEGDFEEKIYGLKISQESFPFIITSIALNPETNVQAGKSVGVKLRFKSNGALAPEGINAQVSIPELGVSSTKFVESIKTTSNQGVFEQDFVLRILDDTPTGTYTVRGDLASQFSGEGTSKQIQFFVIGKSDQTKQIVNDKLIINIHVLEQDIKNDGSEVIYPITFKNEGPEANSYTILLDSTSGIDLRLKESNVFVIEPQESRTINVYASTTEKLEGERIFLVTIKGDDKVLQQIVLKANVVDVKKSSLSATLKNAFEVALIGSVIFLVAFGLFFGFKKLMPESNSDDVSAEIPDRADGEAYY